MICVKLWGRLGNQMFQYAFAVAASRRLGTRFILDDSTDRYVLPRYFRLQVRDHVANAVRGGLGRWLRRQRRALAGVGSFARVEQDVRVGAVAPDAPLADRQLHVGFYQAARHFAGHEELVRDLFRVQPRHVEAFRARHGDTFDGGPTVVLHVRRGDYVSWRVPGLGDEDLSLPWAYFERCLSLVPDLASHRIIAVTDDPDWVRQRLARWPGSRVENSSEIVDFQALAAADVVVLSPSSFSWWAAWLNPKPGKRVFVPARWLGFKVEHEYPAGVVCPGWTEVEVPRDPDR